eukprot:scaffold32420_cov68-Phaeocystis_antarctica.AAC.5
MDTFQGRPHPLEGLGMAPKHGRLEKAEQRHQCHVCMSMVREQPRIPAVFGGHVHLDEWKHACGQPGGVQWGTTLHHQCAQLPDESGNQVQIDGKLLIALGIIRTVRPWSDTHGKQDEQSAKLQRVLPADLSVDGGRANEF